MRIDFYHLTAAPLEKVLPSICEKLVSAGERLLIATEPGRIAELDRQLWTYASDSFLPHSPANQPRAADQPILIAADTAPANGARNIALADGQWRDAALAFDRVFYFFDGSTIDAARANWRALKDCAEVERHYWKQDESGRWREGP